MKFVFSQLENCKNKHLSIVAVNYLGPAPKGINE